MLSISTLAKGNYELIKFKGETTGKKITIKILPASKKIIMERTFKLMLPRYYQILSIKINNQKSLADVNNISFDYSGKPVNIELQLK